MDKAGSSIVAPATPGGAPTPKPSAGGSATGAAATGIAAGASATSAAANWKLRIALILLIGVFVFATAYKLNKKKRAGSGGKKVAAVAGGGGGASGAGAAAGSDVTSPASNLGPIPLPGFPGMKPSEKEKEDGGKK